MFNKNLIKGKHITYKKINYANFANGLNTDIDEYILPINRSVKTYNFNFSNGALVTGLGIEVLKLPVSYFLTYTRDIIFPEEYQIKATWVFRYTSPTNTYSRSDVMVLLNHDGHLYIMRLYETGCQLSKISNKPFSDIPTILNYKLNGNYALLISSVDGFFYWCPDVNQSFVEVTDAPNINSICLHNERAFATVGVKKEEVWFSKELDPTNWKTSLKDGGFISFVDDRGQCNKVVSFLDRVYVFRDYGINRIMGYGNQTEFDVSELYVSSGQIHTKTICVCGDRILMLTDNGLYCFDGTSTTKLNIYINELLTKATNKNAVATYFNGKYYLACFVPFNDGKRVGSEDAPSSSRANNALIELDINTNSINILRGVEITDLKVISDNLVSKLVVCILDKGTYKLGELTNSGTVFGVPTAKLWQSPLSNFGYPEKIKFIKDVYITSKHPVTVTIRNEKGSMKVTKTPMNNLIRISPKISGKLLAIDFESNLAENYISNPTIILGV